MQYHAHKDDDQSDEDDDVVGIRSSQCFDINQGRGMGCHRVLKNPITVKLLYVSLFCVIWILFGSCMFAWLEAKDMEKYQKGSHDFDAMLKTMRTLSGTKQKTVKLTDLQQRQLLHAANFMSKNKPAEISWGLAGGFFFSLLSMTTIGYGRFLVPQTMGGRLFVIPFTLIGIPTLAILYTVFAKWWLHATRRHIRKWNQTRAKGIATAVAMGIFLTLLLGVGPLVFLCLENWSYYEAVYFIWCSISTIGYGDFVPETQAGQWVGVALMPLGLGTCALLLAAISQWFQDLITWFDHDEDSYSKLVSGAESSEKLLGDSNEEGSSSDETNYGSVDPGTKLKATGIDEQV